MKRDGKRMALTGGTGAPQARNGKHSYGETESQRRQHEALPPLRCKHPIVSNPKASSTRSSNSENRRGRRRGTMVFSLGRLLSPLRLLTRLILRKSLMPLWGIFDSYGLLVEGLGLEFVVLLISVFGGLKGALWSVSIESLLPYMREKGLDALVYQQTLTLSLLPWGAKGLLGALSDNVALFRRRKKWYMLTSNVVGVSCCCWLLLEPSSGSGSRSSSSSGVGLLALSLPFFGLHLQMATIDLLCEGLYSAALRANPNLGFALVGFVNLCTTTGGLLGRLLVGPLSDAWGSGPLFCLCLPLALQSFFPVLLNFTGEPKLQLTRSSSSCSNSCSCSRGACRVRNGCCSNVVQVVPQPGQGGVVVVALLTSLCACGAALLVLLELVSLSVAYTVCVLCALAGASLLLLPRRLALCALYFFIDRLLHLNIQGALSYFYTAAPGCVPEGPHFNYTYFSTYTAVAGTTASWIGIWAFQKWFKNWSCRSIFWLTNSLRILDSLFDLALVLRLNKAIGVPDKVMYLLGDGIGFGLIGALTHMGAVVSVSQLCPVGREATVYAVVSGLSNLGFSLSKLMGAFAISAFKISTVHTPETQCDFQYLPHLILLAHLLLPLLALPLAALLLPSYPLNEPPPPVSLAPVEAVTEAETDAETDIEGKGEKGELREESLGSRRTNRTMELRNVHAMPAMSFHAAITAATAAKGEDGETDGETEKELTRRNSRKHAYRQIPTVGEEIEMLQVQAAGEQESNLLYTPGSSSSSNSTSTSSSGGSSSSPSTSSTSSAPRG
ncbi:LOW QUALITY PROTEIN: BT1 transmembrane domain-containing protein, putative [Eimeria necatrix]|uniref:BT1 transmembrane domain-containing protein, putative n=1 Tax=Eimeria necatrix TaxID=51315 RepID=U6MGG5_9EIME|nr:LOW QUALITY PROTEIN: BT1 transmembrane domain-containing protein, putative [Eimeria necatrix]CDJ63106.1 BT1 transmembrane domain-containing protein, putative [Eimeria necatrix]